VERNRDLNHCRFEVINAALAYGSPTVAFHVAANFGQNKVKSDSGSEILVPSITLERIVSRPGFERFSLICDIEGAEAELVRHELAFIADRVAFVLVEIHPRILGDHGVDEVVNALLGAGFQLAEHNGWNWAFFKR
jgi:FkbM family methyltransferase